MKFGTKLRELNSEDIWQEYCGFLDLSVEEYMSIQNRLMEEQIRLWSSCELGKQLLKGKVIRNVEDFRSQFPLTEYEDYADVLLMKRGEMLPDTPIVWIQTTWEGGKHPIKLAPYSKSMLDVYKNNVLACFILGSSKGKGDFDVNIGDTMLYGLAPLPYATGILPLLLLDQLYIEYLPPVEEAQRLSFSERNKLGFKLGLKKGIDHFFAVGSVTYYISKSFGQMGSGKGGGLKSLWKYSPSILARYMKAKKRCKKENRELLPKDVFKLKGFYCAGTDNRCYKDDLERMWGMRPLEIFAGTEPGAMGCETWEKNGLYFFPDACFYEFIPQKEMDHNFEDPSYQPQTCLMNEVLTGEIYELVISVLKGGAFMRYRVGDVYRCLSNDGLPKFEYMDRIPPVIDIAGFTRITDNSVSQAIALSGLPIKDWMACKEFSDENRPYMHMYVELKADALQTTALTKELLREHLSIYFKYLDNDYQDLKKILGIDPLKITVIQVGSFDRYYNGEHHRSRRINPPASEKLGFLKSCGVPYRGGIY